MANEFPQILNFEIENDSQQSDHGSSFTAIENELSYYLELYTYNIGKAEVVE